MNGQEAYPEIWLILPGDIVSRDVRGFRCDLTGPGARGTCGEGDWVSYPIFGSPGENR